MSRSGPRYNLRLSRRRPVRRNQDITFAEAVIVAIVIAAVIAMAVWFFFFAHGGLGPGSV